MENIQDLLEPKVKEFDINFSNKSNPEIFNVSYDLWTLKITLSFNDHPSPIYVIFKNVVGFRVLDEGNLLEFWNPDVRVPGWIWKVESGGWFELEKLRNGFVSQHHSIDHNEYLISSINDCVSVISTSEPIIIDSE
ncbi:hypothetical protein C8C83_3713 [Flavobacterium sp. 90]|uniref:hypothetical protein n=1 Tax=unclassified Flavobacterium TaxID=196869 RepID=UPI000EB0A298|nr:MULTISPECIES: hypothetical protein [unclassified Flavobacterium]RKR11954.1 hypothetical protein C8C82_4032 [Flavobacterium sp. 81]TCK55728.1 hypothetical protein C8C83_3713 [Flavobacterium sp. 90]